MRIVDRLQKRVGWWISKLNSETAFAINCCYKTSQNFVREIHETHEHKPDSWIGFFVAFVYFVDKCFFTLTSLPIRHEKTRSKN